MKIMSFEGASDDLIEIEGDDLYDEEYLPIGGTWTCTVSDPLTEEALDIHVTFTDGGTWGIGVAQPTEDFEVPEWMITITQSETTKYSTRLELEVPDRVRISKVLGEDVV